MIRCVLKAAALLVVAASAAACGPAAVSQTAVATPYVSAAELRPSRDKDRLGELRLAFDVFNSADQSTRQVTLGIGKDYVQVTEGSTRTIFDFRLRRVIDVDLGRGRFFSYSLYGAVHALNQELTSRTMLQAMLNNPKLPDLDIAADVQHAFWRESVLGVADAPAEGLEVSDTDGVVVFQRDQRNIVQFFPALEIDASAAEIANFYKFMRLALTAHPTIVDALKKRRALPQALALRKPDGEESAWSLTRFERIQDDYPLPAEALLSIETVHGWESDIWHDVERHLAVQYVDEGLIFGPTQAPAIDPILPTMLAAAAGRHGGGPPLRDDWLNRMEIAIENDALFEAGLLWTEFNLLWGTLVLDCARGADFPYCKRLRDTITQAQHDQRWQFTMGAMEGLAPGSALAIWSALPKDDAPTSYITDLFLANQVVVKTLANPRSALAEDDKVRANTAKAFELFVSAINGNPYNPSAYKDLGDFYYSRHDYRRAWMAFDLGRSLANAEFVPTLKVVNDLESQIAAKYPEFF